MARARRISVGSTDPPTLFDEVQQRTRVVAPVRSLDGLYRLLADRARSGPSAAPAVLDLIGPSTGQGLLQLGASTIDGASLPVLELFTRMAEERLLPRLGIEELRLLGSRTAAEVAGQDTMRRLAQILRVRVLGSTELLCANHLDEGGFAAAYERHLTDEGALPRQPIAVAAPSDGARVVPFAPDALIATAARELAPVPWPRFVVPSSFDTAALASLLRTGDGRALPGLLALPRCELLIPVRRASPGEARFHAVEILFNWSLVRVRDATNPDGAVYPVISPAKFVRMFIALPQLHR